MTISVQLSNEHVIPHRERCYDCYRPVEFCFCDAIPSITNQTHVLIVQHVRERFHAFNTARIVRRALLNSTLIVDQTDRLAQQRLPFEKSTGVLYPGPGSQLLSDVPVSDRPHQLVILDGTWHHAKTLMRQIPQLQTLPRYRLEPAVPSNYRIRKEPTASAISTLEATVEALRILEPNTAGMDQLLRAFDAMIDAQVQHPAQAGRSRHRGRMLRLPTNIPSALIDDPDRIVVVYGEAAHGPNGIRAKNRTPVYWVAQRLSTRETFQQPLLPCPAASNELLRHLQLSEFDFVTAVDHATFRHRWHEFVKPTDILAAFNLSTLRLLEAIGGLSHSAITLKSVNLRQDCTTLDEKLAALHVKTSPPLLKGRAGQRLANAVAYIEHLRSISVAAES
ncbi:MAG: tRNA-uridine aminocarboxypropyltransferase [Planctomycetaceae bacterium]